MIRPGSAEIARSSPSPSLATLMGVCLRTALPISLRPGARTATYAADRVTKTFREQTAPASTLADGRALSRLVPFTPSIHLGQRVQLL